MIEAKERVEKQQHGPNGYHRALARADGDRVSRLRRRRVPGALAQNPIDDGGAAAMSDAAAFELTDPV